MYEEIRKPRLLKDVPLLIIRGLSTIYYFIRFAQGKESINEKPLRIFDSHLAYLSALLEKCGGDLKQRELFEAKKFLQNIRRQPASHQLQALEDLTIRLARFCSKNRLKIENWIRTNKTGITEIYVEKTEKIHLLLIDNHYDPKQTDKIESLLKKFCFYPTKRTSVTSSGLSAKIVASDFIFYASTHPVDIHENVRALESLGKPGMALASIDKSERDQQAIRHGAQLIKIGFPVLFKVFTPIRLFTSVDKIYMQHQLAASN